MATGMNSRAAPEFCSGLNSITGNKFRQKLEIKLEQHTSILNNIYSLHNMDNKLSTYSFHRYTTHNDSDT
jgi:hypothetical protein